MTGSGPTRPLRVVQIVTTLARGGAQATVLASSDRAALAGRAGGGGAGVDIRVLAGTDRTEEGDHWDDPALDRVVIDPVPHLTRPIHPVADGRALRWLTRWLRRERPDVVHTHSSKAGVIGRAAAALAGVPCVHTVHGWGPIESSNGAARAAAIGLERALARTTAGLVVVGRPDLDTGLRLGIGRPEQYHVIRSGIEFAAVGGPADRVRIRRELGVEDRFVVGMVARMSPQKDQAALLDAVAVAAGAGLPAVTLVLVGDGPNRSALERRAADTGLDVRFLGARADGAAVVAAFDVAVNASRWEGLPRSVVEAAVAGVPVVATDVGATAELIEPGCSGWLVPPGDPAALATALVEVVADPAAAQGRAAEAGRRAAAFSADRMRDELVALWWSVAEPGVRPSGRRAARPDLAPLPGPVDSPHRVGRIGRAGRAGRVVAPGRTPAR